jgi:hypothetical protein
MKHKLLSLALLVTLAPSISFAQQAGAPQGGNRLPREKSFSAISSGKWTGPRLPDGQPNIEGHWSNTIGNHSKAACPEIRKHVTARKAHATNELQVE